MIKEFYNYMKSEYGENPRKISIIISVGLMFMIVLTADKSTRFFYLLKGTVSLVALIAIIVILSIGYSKYLKSN